MSVLSMMSPPTLHIITYRSIYYNILSCHYIKSVRHGFTDANVSTHIMSKSLLYNSTNQYLNSVIKANLFIFIKYFTILSLLFCKCRDAILQSGEVCHGSKYVCRNKVNTILVVLSLFLHSLVISGGNVSVVRGVFV